MPDTTRAGDGGRPAPASHPTSLAVWALPSPAVVNRRFTVTVGVKCAAACPLAGQRIVVRDETGAEVGEGTLGESPAPGTRALYAAEVTLTAPPREGVHSWSVAFEPAAESGETAPASGSPAPTSLEPSAAPRPGSARSRASAVARPNTSTTARLGASARPAPPHAEARTTFGFRATRPPEHRLIVTVRDRDTEAPLRDVEVCVGAYRAATGDSGRATVDVPGGCYEIHTRKAGYAAYTGSVSVHDDVTLEVATAPTSDTDLDDDRLWM